MDNNEIVVEDKNAAIALLDQGLAKYNDTVFIIGGEKYYYALQGYTTGFIKL